MFLLHGKLFFVRETEILKEGVSSKMGFTNFFFPILFLLEPFSYFFIFFIYFPPSFIPTIHPLPPPPTPHAPTITTLLAMTMSSFSLLFIPFLC